MEGTALVVPFLLPMRGVIHQVNVSKGGLPKLAVQEADMTPPGLAGDVQRNTKHHGGPDKAVLIVSLEDIEALAAAGYPVAPGALGENLTIQGVDFRQLRAGMRFLAGSAAIELTTLRKPCSNLDVYDISRDLSIRDAIYDARCKAGDPSSPLWARGGFYARVIRPGRIRVGDPVSLLEVAV